MFRAPSATIQGAYGLFTVEMFRLQHVGMHGILAAMSRTAATHLKPKRQRPCLEAVV